MPPRFGSCGTPAPGLPGFGGRLSQSLLGLKTPVLGPSGPGSATFPWKAGVTFAAWCAAGDVHKWFIPCVGYVARNEHDHSAVTPVTTVSTRSSIAALATITATSAFLAVLAGATNSTAATFLSVTTSPATSASAAFG